MAMAVVITDKVIVQRLTDYIYTGRELDVDSQCVRVAKLFYSVGRCISRLSDYYAAISPSTIEPDSNHPRFFPSITSYRIDATSRSFHYIRQLEQAPSCVTFLAEEVDGGKLIVVKFGRQLALLPIDISLKLALHLRSSTSVVWASMMTPPHTENINWLLWSGLTANQPQT
jgi:hypothetical protein